jgi:transposase-like protein
MGKASIDTKVRAVLLYIEGARGAKDICAVYGIPIRTFRRWIRAYRKSGIDGLKPKRPGPAKGTNSIPRRLEQRIISAF